MANLTDQFVTARGNIEPSVDDVDHASAAHADVRAVLEGDDQFREWGIDSVLIGSYARHVSIRRVKDVDVFCRLLSIDEGVAARDLVDHLFRVLDNAYGVDAWGNRRAKRQDRSVQVAFPEFNELYVDAVPARPAAGGGWEIPQRSDADEAWRLTDPELMTSLSTEMNTVHGGLYVPTVKLVRQARRSLLGKARPGGFWFEMALYEACRAGKVPSSGTQAEQFTAGLEAIADLIDAKVDRDEDLPNPAMAGEIIHVRVSDTEWATAQEKVRAAASAARAAFKEEDRCVAAVGFQPLLGGNDEHDEVFPLPGDCNADGTRKFGAGLITAGDRDVPAGTRRFG